jgi:hypothetical protein
MSFSSINIRLPGGSGSQKLVALSVEQLLGSLSNAFTFDYIRMSSIRTRNAAASGSQTISVFGINFGSSDSTTSSGFGRSVTTATVWMSNTVLATKMPRGYGRGHSVTLSVGLQVIESSSIFRITTRPLQVGKYFASSVIVGSVFIVAGGVAHDFLLSEKYPSASYDIYSLSTFTVIATGTLSSARYKMAAASLGKHALFAGGRNLNQELSDVDIFDADSGIWSVSYLSNPRSHLASCVDQRNLRVYFGVNRYFRSKEYVVFKQIGTEYSSLQFIMRHKP